MTWDKKQKVLSAVLKSASGTLHQVLLENHRNFFIFGSALKNRRILSLFAAEEKLWVPFADCGKYILIGQTHKNKKKSNKTTVKD